MVWFAAHWVSAWSLMLIDTGMRHDVDGHNSPYRRPSRTLLPGLLVEISTSYGAARSTVFLVAGDPVVAVNGFRYCRESRRVSEASSQGRERSS